MAGHSKWKNIRYKKEAMDQKRSKTFAKLLRAITAAAQDDPDPDHNPRLRTIIEKARRELMPQDTIKRAIQRASESGPLEELTLEAYGAGGSALIITALTDNKNRTIPEIKTIINSHNGKWAEAGSVLWAFEHEKEGGTEWKPKFPLTVTDEEKDAVLRLVTALEAHSDVEAVYVNIDLG